MQSINQTTAMHQILRTLAAYEVDASIVYLLASLISFGGSVAIVLTLAK